MTTAPEEEPRKRPRRETVDLLGVEDGVQKGLVVLAGTNWLWLSKPFWDPILLGR